VVAPDVNSGPPSVDNSSGVPNVINDVLSISISPIAPFVDLQVTGQFEYLSTMMR